MEEYNKTSVAALTKLSNNIQTLQFTNQALFDVLQKIVMEIKTSVAALNKNQLIIVDRLEGLQNGFNGVYKQYHEFKGPLQQEQEKRQREINTNFRRW